MDAPGQQQKNFLIDCLNLSLNQDTSEAEVRQLDDSQWHGLEAQAEYHSVAPLVYREIKKHHIRIPPKQLLLLKALVIRHRRANALRFSCLQEIASLFTENDIDLIALKGAALAHILYDTPSLRPMNDMDLLVPSKKADHTAALLLESGYFMPHGLHKFNHQPHHLPMLQKKVQGLTVTVELHKDTMHRDSTHSMTMDDLTEKPQTFTCGQHIRIKALNHTDMLCHLCRHSFSAARELRLIHLYDIMAYAAKFHDRIDWQKIHQRFPYVINGLRCVHFIFPCPDQLAEKVRPPTGPGPKGCGEAMKPLSKIVQRGRPPLQIFRELFLPPPWWKHAYYNISPEKSLLLCNWITHPAMVCRWLGLRTVSAVHAALHSQQKTFSTNRNSDDCRCRKKPRHQRR